jgi:phage-related protein
VSLAIQGDWEGFGEKLREVWDGIWEAIKTVLGNAWDNIKIVVGEIISSIISFFRDTDWGATGRGIIDGIIQGIKNGVGALVDAVKAAAQAALDAAKGFLGIESPSKAFALEVAGPSIEGWAGTLERGVARIRAASGRLAEASVEGAGKAIWATRPSCGPAGLGGLVINIYFNADSVRSERDIYRMAEEIERSLTLRVLPRLVT